MNKLLRFDEYSTNEIFGFLNKKYEFDSRAKEVFKELLNNIQGLEVQEFSDYRREVTLKEKDQKDSDEFLESRNMRVPRDEKVIKTQTTSKELPSFKQKYKHGDIDVAVMKNYSKHRLSSKILGNGKQNSYSLSINNQHFISDERGKEGQFLVNPKISEMYWNFLSDIGNAQEKYKKRNLRESEYDSELSRIKSKYQIQLSKF